jgi:YVTN family beta-propeller protein
VAISPDQRVAYVANQGDGTISVVALREAKTITTLLVGSQPYGVVATPLGLFVTDIARWEVVRVDPVKLEVTARTPVEPFPSGLAATGDGKRLLVTHLFNGRVTAIDAATMSLLGGVSTGADTNLSQHIGLSPDGSRAYLPQTRSNASNPSLLFDSTLFPVVNVLDLRRGELNRRERITLDTADRPVDLPLSTALSPDGRTLYVANAGSNDLSVINVGTGEGVANIRLGAHPRGLALSPDGSWLYVNNTLDGKLTVIDTRTLNVVGDVPLTTIPLAPPLLLGKRLFHSSASESLAKDGWISCTACHFDGGHDGRTWRGFPDGPRNTPALFGVGRTLPVHWSGDLDELQDVELTIRKVQVGKGLIPGEAYDTLGPSHTGLSEPLDALALFMASLSLPLSPCTTEEGALTAAARRGDKLFAASGCSVCHIPPLYTDHQLHDVGTGDPATERNSHGRGTQFDTPSLLGVWATAPYFHDGSVASLRDLLTGRRQGRDSGDPHALSDRLTPKQLADLVLFLRSLPAR